ncbi:hypothetical protein BWK47_14470 [Synechocystis sp. CACIAM 05]|nr:hypothetical protein BWK47_14470 [Synechocystis sp. CACIAM 05]
MAWREEELIERKAESLRQPMPQFYKLTTEAINQLITTDLPESTHRLWICGLVSFGDRRIVRDKNAPTNFGGLPFSVASEAIGECQTRIV